MSAFIVSRHHIDAIVAVAIFGPAAVPIHPSAGWHTVSWFDTEPPPGAGISWCHEHRRTATLETAIDLGELLMLENIRSVNHRYPDNHSLPGDASHDPDWTTSYVTPLRTLRRGTRPTAVETLKLIDSYEYQTCEHDTWRTSETRRFCDALRRTLISCLPGYDDAPWEWTQPLLPAAAAAGPG